ncbi:MAG: hypothetical protein HYR55_03635 [Acidobacteria bacterium]|nr:hypothetical protein [Acidobacteriota bacterium]MBI3656934.1 hypothetical protein [Acidobacteriota bacterium]
MRKIKRCRKQSLVLFMALGMALYLTAPVLAATAGTTSEDPLPIIGAQIREVIENIDLKCYRIQDRPLDRNLLLQHLNPVLIDRGWPEEPVVLFEAQQLCVPVAKDGRIPPERVLALIQWLDLKCYRIQGQPINESIFLSHLNPVLIERGWPDEEVIVTEPQQLCVPVAKDGQIPPPAALNLVQWIDLKAYGIIGPPPSPDEIISLKHLNPVLQRRQWPDERVVVGEATQLMVPVAKNGRMPTDDVLLLASFIDLKCHRIIDRPINQPLRLTHLNPVLREMQAPDETVMVMEPVQLCVPVVKDGVFPE